MHCCAVLVLAGRTPVPCVLCTKPQRSRIVLCQKLNQSAKSSCSLGHAHSECFVQLTRFTRFISLAFFYYQNLTYLGWNCGVLNFYGRLLLYTLLGLGAPIMLIKWLLIRELVNPRSVSIFMTWRLLTDWVDVLEVPRYGSVTSRGFNVYAFSNFLMKFLEKYSFHRFFS